METKRLREIEQRVAHLEQCIRELCLVLSDRDPKLWEYMQKLINSLPANDASSSDPRAGD
jgi:uncharacterized coiled-coil protein SlyX